MFCGSTQLQNTPVHLLTLADRLLSVTVRGSALLLDGLFVSRIFFLLHFVVGISRDDLDRAFRIALAKPEVRIIKHVARHGDRFWSEVYCRQSAMRLRV